MEEIINIDAPGIDEESFNEEVKKGVTLGDIIIIQLILCVLIILALAVSNIFKPEITNEILHNINSELKKPFDYQKELADIYDKLSQYINAKI